MSIIPTVIYLDNWSDELNQERFNFKKRWPEGVDEVDQQPFDMGTIMILNFGCQSMSKQNLSLIS